MFSRIVLGLGIFSLMTLVGRRKPCKGDGRILRYDLTAPNWEWFVHPEGTRIAYESNLGGKDTAVFGAVYVREEKCCHDDKECSTDIIQKINQDITWLHGLKGRLRPVKLVSKGGPYQGLYIVYSDDSSNQSYYEEYHMKDTLTVNGVKYMDVHCCDSPIVPPYPIQEVKLSKTGFYLKISYQLPNNTIETWERK